MINLTKDKNIPSSLKGANIATELANLRGKIAKGQKISYKDFNSAIYAANDVKRQLLTDQHNKCIFCGCDLLAQDGGEVEHYRPKTAYRQDRTPHNTQKPGYYWLAYDWDNLLCSCHACNRRKSTFFPLEDDAKREIANEKIDNEKPLIINPYTEKPEKSIIFRSHVIYPVIDSCGNEDKKGKATIDFLELNRNDLKELRKRKLNIFRKRMASLGLSFDQMFDIIKNEQISTGYNENDIDFLGMYNNQQNKF